MTQDDPLVRIDLSSKDKTFREEKSGFDHNAEKIIKI
jgi:hypothetical protein